MPLFKQPIEQMLINLKLKAGKPLTDLEFYARELTLWERSPERKEMLDGERYYVNDHDILKRVRTAIGEDGKLIKVDNVPNNRIVDNQYAVHVDKKANYLLGKPISFESENAEYAEAVKSVMGTKFMRTLKNAGVEALNSGIAWLYPCYKNNKLVFRSFPGYEILPFWADKAHTELDAALRLYSVEVYTGREKKIVKKVDLFTLDGVQTFLFENGILKPDPDAEQSQSYITINGKPFNWERFPLIPIKYNSKEIPLIRRARTMQDAINLMESDFINCMEEDAGSSILVIRNAEKEDLGALRKNLNAYRAIKVRTFDGKDGDVSTLEIEVNAENYKLILSLLKTALIENMRSYDAKDDRLANNPNQMNIQSVYSEIDLDANGMETELQAAFEDILWFVKTYLANVGKGDFSNDNMTVIFNRDMLINESEAIENCSKSTGLISDELIVSMHPWVKDPAQEMERLKKQKEKEEADPYRNAFEQANLERQNGGGLNAE